MVSAAELRARRERLAEGRRILAERRESLLRRDRRTTLRPTTKQPLSFKDRTALRNVPGLENTKVSDLAKKGFKIIRYPNGKIKEAYTESTFVESKRKGVPKFSKVKNKSIIFDNEGNLLRVVEKKSFRTKSGKKSTFTNRIFIFRKNGTLREEQQFQSVRGKIRLSKKVRFRNGQKDILVSRKFKDKTKITPQKVKKTAIQKAGGILIQKSGKLIVKDPDGKFAEFKRQPGEVGSAKRVIAQRNRFGLTQLQASRINKKLVKARQKDIKQGTIKKDIPVWLYKVADKQFKKDPKAKKITITHEGQKITFERQSQATGDIKAVDLSLRGKLEKLRGQAITKTQRQRGVGIGERLFSGIAVAGVLGFARGVLGVYDTVRHPIKTAKAQFQAFRPKNFKSTVVALGNEFKVDPIGVVAEFYTYGKVLNLAGSSIKKSKVGQYVVEETFIASQPKEIRPSVRAIVRSDRVQRNVNPGRVNKITKADFMEVKSLNKIEAKTLVKTLKNTDTVIFGSLVTRVFGKKTKLRSKIPIPKDVDLATANVKQFGRAYINNLPKNIRKNYRLRGEKLIRLSNGEAIFDVKPLKRLIPQRSLLTKKGRLPVSGYVTKVTKKGVKKKAVEAAIEVPTGKIKEVKGIKIIGFGEQTTRKALGTLQVLIEKNVRRAKDPQALLINLEIQLNALKKAKPKTAIGRLRNKSRIKTLSNAIKLLKSKQFAKLLEKKVPGLTKQYPLLKKLSPKKLRKINLKQVRKKVKEQIKKLPKAKVRKKPITKKEKKKLKVKKKRVSKLKVTKRKPSKLPKKRPSRIPSKLPKKRPSKIPSKIQKKRPSKIPSKIPSRLKVSKVPSKLKPSKLPSKLKPSKIASKIPSKLKPSRLKPSRIPPSRIPRRIGKRKKLPISAEKRRQLKRKKEELREKKRKPIEPPPIQRNFIFTSDLVSRFFDIKATAKERKKFLKVGQLFTGLERRKVTRKRKKR